jgi:hypothetical protein
MPYLPQRAKRINPPAIGFNPLERTYRPEHLAAHRLVRRFGFPYSTARTITELHRQPRPD